MEEPLKIAICEDSPEDEKILLDILTSSSTPCSCTVFRNGEDLLKAYEPLAYDLLLSDIYMTGITGVETVARIREIDEEIPVAFVTSSPDHALESYRLNVLKYIEKPYKPNDIDSILHLAKMNRDSAPALIMLKNGKENRVRFSQILYLEQQTHHVSIYTRSGSQVSVYDKLSALVPQLEQEGFYSPHKSYYVNLNFVRSIDAEFRCFLMADGGRVPIRRESMGQARRTLEEHLFRKARGNS